MKVKKSVRIGNESLSLKNLRAIEQELGIYLNTPVDPRRSINQQFGVLDENEVQAGDISADKRFFSEKELRAKIEEVFA